MENKNFEFIRHGESDYKNLKKQAQENPNEPIDYNEQIYPDLSERGEKNAKEKSRECLSGLDSEKDALFIVTSKEARAIQTADIFRQTAHSLGFEVLKAGEKEKNKIAKEVGGGGEIRTLRNLSLHVENPYFGDIFLPNSIMSEKIIENEKVSKEEVKKFREARKIIDADDKGSWGANFFHHSEAVSEIIPELKSTKKRYESNFKNLMKLAKFGAKKIGEAGHNKNIKVLAFGHEDYTSYALNEYFGEHEIKNCESLGINVEGDEISLEYRGDSKKVE